MRPIKFRAWDNKEKKWLLGYELEGLGGFSMFGECMLMGEWEQVLNSRPLQELDTIKLMQFTGLLDKTGKEIYEGDIVKRWNGGIAPVEWRGSKFVVRYDETPEYFEELESYLSPSLTNTKQRTEIIGNVWENPDLTK